MWTGRDSGSRLKSKRNGTRRTRISVRMKQDQTKNGFVRSASSAGFHPRHPRSVLICEEAEWPSGTSASAGRCSPPCSCSPRSCSASRRTAGSASNCFPNVDVPVVVVTTTLNGASVDEMESAVTKPVEETVNTVSGIDELRSTTKEGFSQIVVGFKLEKNGDVAAQEVRDKMCTLHAAAAGRHRSADRGEVQPRRRPGGHDRRVRPAVAARSHRDRQEADQGRPRSRLRRRRGRAGRRAEVGPSTSGLDPTKLRGRELSVEDVRQALHAAEPRTARRPGRFRQPRGSAARRSAACRSRRTSPTSSSPTATATRCASAMWQRVEDGVEEPRGAVAGSTATSR